MPKDQITHPIRISELPKAKKMSFDVVFSAAELAAIADILSARSVKKMRIHGNLIPSGAKDWILNAAVGATVIQSCVITLDPVQTRIDTSVALTYDAKFQVNADENATEMMPDETIEPLVDEIDLATIAIEAVALALPDYPRSQDAQLENAIFAKPGVTPLRDEDTKPFASLASLKDKLSKEDK